MKKIVISLGLVAILLFAGCSCNSASPLSFTNSWNDGTNPNIGYTEVHKYSVSYDDNYSSGDYNFAKSNDLSKEAFGFSFSNGSYETTLTVVDKGQIPTGATSDILDGYNEGVFKYLTKFKITANYACADNAYEDYVTTESYFCGSSASFAPIYSKTENKSSILSIKNGKASVKEIHTLNEIFYSKKSYTIKEYDAVSKELLDTDKYSYSFKTAVDNTQILFALRASTFKSSITLPAVNTTYGSVQRLAVKAYQDNVTEQITVNSNSADCEMQCISFMLSSASASCVGNGTTNTGRAQLVFKQAKENDVLTKNKGQIVKYVTPLSTYDTFYLMGALVYQLDSVA